MQAVMSHWQRGTGILAVLVILSSWCILLGGIGGWLLGYDQGRRETVETFLPERGVLVTRVERGSPAEQAGIARGHLIVAVNGVSIHDVVSLRDELLRYRPGDQVLVTYRHELGEEVTYVLLGHVPGRATPYLGIYFTARAEQPADI
ncbi:MAG: PDZ domain-containing protein [Chloroflexaceae bacterium]|nr:PDZ domain-containing protein [Chloroflexaceae bacterium]